MNNNILLNSIRFGLKKMIIFHENNLLCYYISTLAVLHRMRKKLYIHSAKL